MVRNHKGGGGGGRSIHFLKALFKTNSEINVSIKTMAKGVLKMFGTKVLYFTMLYELECFLLSFIGDHGIFVCGVIRSVKFIFVDRYFISLMVAELLLLNQENSYVLFNWRQLVNHDIFKNLSLRLNSTDLKAIKTNLQPPLL